jgi:hypothetical protein
MLGTAVNQLNLPFWHQVASTVTDVDVLENIKKNVALITVIPLISEESVS